MTSPHQTVARARDMGASQEAIIRAVLSGMTLRDGLALMAKLQTEWLRKQQAATHNAPIGSRRET